MGWSADGRAAGGCGCGSAGMAVAGQAIPFVLLGDAARRASSGDLALMMGAAPIVAFVLSRWLGEGPPWTLASASGLALGLIGVAVAVGGPGGGSVLGKVEGFRGRLLLRLRRDVFARRLARRRAVDRRRRLDVALVAACWASVYFASGGSLAKLAAIPTPSLEAMAALGVFNTALRLFRLFRAGHADGRDLRDAQQLPGAVRRADPRRVFLHETIALSAWAGLALVIVGRRADRRARRGRGAAAPARRETVARPS